MSLYEDRYEASDEASENELLDKSLSVWRGWSTFETRDDFQPISLDLHTASSIGQFDRVRAYIQSDKEDLNRKNRGGWTPLMYACYIGHDTIVNLLLDANVNVNVKNSKGQTPLMLAASCGNESVGYFLLQAGAEMEARDRKGWTALFHATYAGHQDMVKFLLNSGANTEAVEPSRGMTPFIEAASEGHEIIVQYLLQHGVNLNAKTYNGDSARSLALINGHMKIVSLIDHHVNPSAPLRADAGLSLIPDADLSSSDEAFQKPRPPSHRHSKPKLKGPSIRDGPEAMAKKLKDKRGAQSEHRNQPHIPKGYVTFKDDLDPVSRGLCYRDMTSPINAEDHTLDSFGVMDGDDKADVFSATGALTIKSSSGSSGGLAQAFGLSREDSTDSGSEDLGQGHQCHKDKGQSQKPEEDHHGHHESKHVKSSQEQDGEVVNQNGGNCSSQEKGEPSGIARYFQEPQVSRSGEPSPGNDFDFLCGVPPPGGVLPGRDSNNRARDLKTFLEELQLSKYLKVLEDEDVDLQVFLSLTDNDLKEVGIKLMGPRRKMTSGIARWHSNARPARNDLEQAYADRLEAEMQEMAIQLHKANAEIQHLQAQLLQEKQLRSVAENCLMEDRAAWQQVVTMTTETKQQCQVMEEGLLKMRLCQKLREKQDELGHTQSSKKEECNLTNLIEGLTMDDKSKALANEIEDKSSGGLNLIMETALSELEKCLSKTKINTSKLLGRSQEAVQEER
ncbi:ankyrin repeat and SAM domain-containing protein 3 isoform X1 [Lingula anatina]|uniref:Ankyrin repeat and SAM domain-containing protein 3 isoform X1 n=1 Tax=Lingula anatina TaxID=7574 RepID=A0A1S3KE69_LINAN|nr:ankyrin repeat and SAM domain-containing protein 3 isoform X1 [Lingula anatina]|eukprot:XP_013420925.1 ankyrin repeat and SAM domain-containing protein 3 isoform X1 [Lingula anatina]